jgi:hypothetical protein
VSIWLSDAVFLGDEAADLNRVVEVANLSSGRPEMALRSPAFTAASTAGHQSRHPARSARGVLVSCGPRTSNKTQINRTKPRMLKSREEPESTIPPASGTLRLAESSRPITETRGFVCGGAIVDGRRTPICRRILGETVGGLNFVHKPLIGTQKKISDAQCNCRSHHLVCNSCFHSRPLRCRLFLRLQRCLGSIALSGPGSAGFIGSDWGPVAYIDSFGSGRHASQCRRAGRQYPFTSRGPQIPVDSLITLVRVRVAVELRAEQR